MRVKVLIPILRMFDETRAREFYLDYLGGQIAFEHRFGDDFPLYMGVLIGGVELHLSEHHGDGTPGTYVRLEIDDVRAFHAELTAKNYKYLRPGLQEQDWGFIEISLSDPFGNKLIFCEPQESLKAQRLGRTSG